MSIRALIVDDEPLARQSVRRFLKSHPDIEVVGESGDGQSAASAILDQKPDLVFLDVQMPEMDGFEVVSRVGVEHMPWTIFVTAYDQYALRAFDANALDYLLKLFGKTRFERALARARERIAGSLDREAAERILRAMESVASRGRYLDRLPVSENGRILFVNARDIQWIEAAGNYARLHAAGRSHDVRETLTSLEGKLDPAHFLRIHRSAIVNVQFVREVHPWFHGYHLVLLENGKKLRMSRYQREIAGRLGLAARREG
jgi:two-component system LytT family response regulator